MEAEWLDLLRAPGSLQPLRPQGNILIEEGGSRRFPIRNGIPCLLPVDPPRRARRWKTFYDGAAFAYDATLRLAHQLRLGSEQRIRSEFLAGLKIPAGNLIVDVGCGTGNSRSAFPNNAPYLGLDLSFNMLRRAQAKAARKGQHDLFVQAEAEALPVRNAVAGLVLAMGLLQHVGNPSQALDQMARVAGSGGRLLLIDELRSLNSLLISLGEPVQQQDVEQRVARLAEWCAAELNLQQVDRIIFGEYYILGLNKQS